MTDARILLPDSGADSLLRGSPEPWWNESAWFGFAIPERGINGFFYYWHRPNMNLVAGGVAVWDATGSHRDDCLYYHWFPFNPMPAGADMFSFSLGNGMRVQTLEVLRAYHLTFEAEGCSLDLIWRGVTPAYDVSFSTGGKRGTEDFGNFHYEQLGHVTGTLVVDGERLDVDCHHVRDRSWGLRKPFLPNLRGGLEMAWASERLAFSATMITPDSGTAADEADHLAYGMMIVDGVLSVPASGHRRVLERAPDGAPLAVQVELVDPEGRTISATGRMRNRLRYVDLWYVDWCLVEWEVNGEHGWGESQDMASVDAVRRRQRNTQI